jgi:LuxR family maltose regulon positive regulatory protein
VPSLLWTRIHLALADAASARDSFDQLMTAQVQRPNVPRGIELCLVEIDLLMAEGRPGDAAARLADLVLTSSLIDYGAIVRVGGVLLRAKLRKLAAERPISEVVLRRLGQVLGDDWLNRAELAYHEAVPVVACDDVLTIRERRVVELLSVGLSNKEIGRKLHLSDNTVKFHLRNIYSKLKVGTRLAAVNVARHKGVLAGR